MSGKRYQGRHRRCRSELWCGGARCRPAVQHHGEHLRGER